MVRGSVIWVALDPTQGAEVPKTRPCVIVSREIANEISQTITIVPLSSLRGRRQERLVQPLVPARASHLSKDSREPMQRIDRGLVLHLTLEESVRTGPEQA